jgi:hypothetical protein
MNASDWIPALLALASVVGCSKDEPSPTLAPDVPLSAMAPTPAASAQAPATPAPAVDIDSPKFEQEITEVIAEYEAMKLAEPQAFAKLCTQAGFISSATNLRPDRDRFNRWRAIEKSDCKKAGMKPKPD